MAFYIKEKNPILYKLSDSSKRLKLSQKKSFYHSEKIKINLTNELI